MIDYNRHNEIEEYLSGNLSAEERAAFEKRLENDQSLRHELDLQKMANTVILGGAKEDLRNKLKQIHSSNKKAQLKMKLGIVFGILLILGLALTVVLNQDDDSSNQGEGKQSLKEIVVEESKKGSEINENTERKKKNGEVQYSYDYQPKPEEVAAVKRDFGFKLEVDSEEVTLDNTVQYSENPTDKNSDLLEKGSDSDRELKNEELDPCYEVKKIKPQFDVQAPCFGKSQGVLRLIGSTFQEFAVNNQNPIFESSEMEIGPGVFNMVAKDGNDCLSEITSVKVEYGECNFSIQPRMDKNLEFNFNEFEEPIVFELRNARSGILVYSQKVEFSGTFEYKGLDQSGQQLPMGNYVYVFKRENGAFISKGQLTIIE